MKKSTLDEQLAKWDKTLRKKPQWTWKIIDLKIKQKDKNNRDKLQCDLRTSNVGGKGVAEKRGGGRKENVLKEKCPEISQFW